MDERVSKVDERVSKVDERVSKVDARVSKVDARVSKVDARVSKVNESSSNSPLLPHPPFLSLLTLLAMIKFIFVAVYARQRMSIRLNAYFDGFCYGGVKVYQPQVKTSW